MTTDLTPAPDLGAWLGELERLHAAWQVGGWDGFEAGLKLPHAVPRLVAAVRAVEALADEHEKWSRINGDLAYRFSAQGEPENEQYHLGLKQAQKVSADRLRSTLTAALTSERTTP